jgi:hypothetical protein
VQALVVERPRVATVGADGEAPADASGHRRDVSARMPNRSSPARVAALVDPVRRAHQDARHLPHVPTGYQSSLWLGGFGGTRG